MNNIYLCIVYTYCILTKIILCFNIAALFLRTVRTFITFTKKLRCLKMAITLFLVSFCAFSAYARPQTCTALDCIAIDVMMRWLNERLLIAAGVNDGMLHILCIKQSLLQWLKGGNERYPTIYEVRVQASKQVVWRFWWILLLFFYVLEAK